MLLQGQWPHPLPLLIAWLKDDVGISAVSKLPDDMKDHLPCVMVTPAPGGGQGADYTRMRSVDIDVYAADWKSMADITGRIEASIFRFGGRGNRYGYVDASQITEFSQIAYERAAGVLRCTATASLDMRPKTSLK